MSSEIAKRHVEREVRVFRCDKCNVEAVDLGLVGWLSAAVVEATPDVYGHPSMKLSNTTERHLCPKCLPLLEAFVRGAAVA